VEPDTRVDFYILATAGQNSRLQFACRLTEKAYGQKHRVYAHTASADEARELDELLWTFRQGSFIPHQLISETADDRTPVRIGTPTGADDSGELLINLAPAAPAFTGNFARVAEIIDASEASKEAGRERFRQYRAMGYAPVTHTID
jgi:DNA polymerase III subunit chi